MATEQERIKLLKQIRALQKEIETLGNSQTTSAQDRLDIELQIKKNKSEIVTTSRKLLKANEEIRRLTQEYLQTQIELESRISSISDQQHFIKDIEKKRIQNLNTIHTSLTDNLDAFNQMSDVNQQIANLSSDEISRAELLNNEYESIASNIDRRGSGVKEQLQLLEEQNKLANQYASLSETQRDILSGHRAVLDGIKKSMIGVVETASVLVSTTGGMFGSALIGAGFLMDKLGHTAHETGTFFDEMTLSATGLNFIFSDATNVAKGLSKELGGIEHATFGAQLQTNLLANNLNISGDEAVSLVAAFSRLNGNSTEIAASTIQITKTLAKQHGVIPAQVMADMAGSTKAFAEYGKDGGRNIAEAAVYAAKLGVNMDALTTVTDSLLDFETSMVKELELGVLLGRSINLNKARQLAYEGEIGSAVKESLNQMGGIESFNRMDIYQKRAAAEAIGLSVDELQKMSANMDKLNADGSIQLSQAGQIGQSFDYISETMKGILTGPGGGFLKMLGSGAIAMGQMGFPLRNMKTDLTNMVTSTKNILKNIGSKAWKMLGGGTGSQFAGGSLSRGKEILSKRKGKGSMIEAIKDGVVGKKETPSLDTGSVTDKINKTSGKKGMNVGNMLKGAAAILVLSAALYVAAKAFQEFADVKWQDVTLGLSGLAGLAGIAFILGKAQGQMIQGAAAVAILGAALIPFAFSMSLISGLDINSVLAAVVGLVAFGVAAALIGSFLPLILAGALGIAALGASLIVFGLGLSSIAPSLEAFGKLITTIFGGMSSLVESISSSFIKLMDSINSEKLGNMFLLGPALASVAIGLGILSGALLISFPAMILGAIGLSILTPAVLGFGSSLKIINPIVETFGNTLNKVFSGISSLVESVSSSFIKLMDSINSEKIQNLFLLGPALASAALGLGLFSFALGAASIGSFFGGGIISTLGELSMMSVGLSSVALSLMSIGAGIGLISDNLTKLNTEKLEALKDFSTTISISGAISGIADSVSGMIDSVTGVVGGETLSKYETTMLDKMNELIGAVKTNKDVYIDKDKITKVLSKSLEKRTENLIGLSVA